MPFLPLDKPLFENVDEIGNTVAVTKLQDVVKDDLRNNRPRFRLAPFADLGVQAAVDGVFRFHDRPFCAAVAGGKLFKLTEDGTVTEITAPGGVLLSASRASMADFGGTAYVCNGGAILEWPLDTESAAAIVDPDAPKTATRVAFFDQYLLASIAGSQRWEWSDVGAPGNWLDEFATAGTRPDNIVGVYTAFGEIALPGTETIEWWSDLGDALSPFGRLSGSLTERGVLAPDSFTLVDNTYFFLDQERRVIRLEGRTPRVVSNPIEAELVKVAEPEEGIGFAVNGKGQTLYVLTFPSSGRTFAYNYKVDDWTEFSFWNDTDGTREAFRASSAVYHPEWGNTILGSRALDGKIYQATFDTDTDDGAPVRGEIVTGRIDWKRPDVKKKSRRLRLTLKRGTSGLAGSSESSVFVQWRDDGTTEWSTALEGKLGPAGGEYSFIDFPRLGRYLSRQWRFLLPSVDTVLVSAHETLGG